MLQMLGKEFFQRQKTAIFILVFFSLIVLFFNLGKRSFWEPDEGRYAEISREMVESGDWLTPRLNYIKHFDKPPITYWLIGSSFRLFGFNEFAGHLPLVILGLSGVLITFFLSKELFGIRAGFLSAIILISSLGYPTISRILSTDIIFTVLCLACYLFFIQKKYLLFYLFMGLGFMTKGPVVLVITLIPILIFIIYQKEFHIFKEMRLGPGLLLFAAVGLPWFIYQILLNKGLLFDWTFQQTLGRIVRQNKEPFYFFVPVLIGVFFPWIFFLVPALKKYFSIKGPEAGRNPNARLIFFWFLIPFIFFSCIGKKLIPYMAPLLAPLAIITGRIWDEAIDDSGVISSRIFATCYYIFLSCLAIFLMAIIAFLSFDFDVPFDIALIRPNLIVMCFIFTGGIIATLSFFKSGKTKRLFGAIVLTSALFFLAVIDLLPKIETSSSKSIKPMAMRIKQNLRPEHKIVNYRCFLKSLPFYLSRRIIVVERQRNIAYEGSFPHWQDYLLEDKKDLYRLLSTKGLKVFCITYTWEFEVIEKEYAGSLDFLGQAGKYVLFANK